MRDGKTVLDSDADTATLYNATLHKWREGCMTDIDAVGVLSAHHENAQTVRSLDALMRVQLERADIDAAREILSADSGKFGGAPGFADLERRVESWKLPPLRRRTLFEGDTYQSLEFALYSPDGKRAYAAMTQYPPGIHITEGFVLVYDVASGDEIARYNIEKAALDARLRAGCLSADGKVLYLGTAQSGQVFSMDADTGEVISVRTLSYYARHSKRYVMRLWLGDDERALYAVATHYPNGDEGRCIDETVFFSVADGCLGCLQDAHETPQNIPFLSWPERQSANGRPACSWAK